MKYITAEEAEASLKSEHYQNFISAMKRAQEDSIKFVAQHPDITPRTKSNFVNDKIRSYIREQYSNNQSYKILEPHSSFFLIIGKIAARFKKLRNSRPSNIVTGQTTLIEMQQLDLGEEMKSPTIVNVGYVTNKAGDVWRYKISCLIGKQLLWTVDITPDAEGTAMPVPIPETDIPPQAGQVKRVHKKAQ